MLHPIQLPPESACLDRIVALQQALIRALCQPAVNPAQVSATWLQRVWPTMPAEWARRFLENDKGIRRSEMKKIARAATAEKAAILRVCESQWQFAKLYVAPATHRIEPLANVPAALTESLHKLLTDFYAPWMDAKDGRGYPEPVANPGSDFRRPGYVTCWLGTNTRVCVYCDRDLRECQCDHVLPKAHFPALSCAPQNLVPVCESCNGFTVKGDQVPLTLVSTVQAEEWFHPYARSGSKSFAVHFQRGGAKGWSVALEPVTPVDAARVRNLDTLLGISTFWRGLAIEYLREAGTIIRNWRNDDGTRMTREQLRRRLITSSQQAESELAVRGMSILYMYLYRYCAEDNAQFEFLRWRCFVSPGPVIRLGADQDGLHKSTKKISKYWRRKRERRHEPLRIN